MPTEYKTVHYVCPADVFIPQLDRINSGVMIPSECCTFKVSKTIPSVWNSIRLTSERRAYLVFFPNEVILC